MLLRQDLADRHIFMNPLKIRTIDILKSRNINSLMKMRLRSAYPEGIAKI